MGREGILKIGPFSVDLADERLWRGTEEVILRPKSFAVLRYFLDHMGRLVTKEELLHAVWNGVAVSDAGLAVCIGEIRKALRDDARFPQFIQTVHKRGYRFVAPAPLPAAAAGKDLARESGIVGREAELGKFHGWLERALAGKRQVVFVAGMPGIGKTALVEAFVQGLPRAHLWVGRGQCIEHHGAAEAYMPFLEALGRLCRDAGDKRLIEILARLAPSWLLEIPGLHTSEEVERLRRRAARATQEKMLRQIAGALEEIAAKRPVVLVLEDLHWSDHATLGLISMLSRRQEPARLLLIATYRPVEVIVGHHPLREIKQELRLHGQCEELNLDLLSEADVADYLRARFGWSEVPKGLAPVIYRRTDGNPLFMVNVVDYMVRQGWIAEQGGGCWKPGEGAEIEVPESLRQMIEKHVEKLAADEQGLLEAASVAGMEFSAAAVAAALGRDVLWVEERCERLARRQQFLKAAGKAEWPDGTVASRYAFLHSLYQDVLYQRVTAARQAHLHRRIGACEEQGYGERGGEIAVELAMHFECGGDYRRAADYLGRAGENAVRRYAYREAIDHIDSGLHLLRRLPDTPERAEQELSLQLALSMPLVAARGGAAAEVGALYNRARELCHRVGNMQRLFPVLRGLWTFSLLRAQLVDALKLVGEFSRLTESTKDRDLLIETYRAAGTTLYFQGEFVRARERLEQAVALYESGQFSPLSGFLYGHGRNPGITCLCYAARVLWHLGYAEQALEKGERALALAREEAHPFTLAFVLSSTAWLYQNHRQADVVRKRAEEAIALAQEHGLAIVLAQATILRGRALAEQGNGEEGIKAMHQGLEAWRATEAEVSRPYYLALLAQAYGRARRTEEGLRMVEEALATCRQSTEHMWEAMLYWLKGELLIQGRNRSRGQANGAAAVEECFHKSVAIARRQQAKSVELRAALSLARLWQKQGKREEARRILGEIYSWFTEGFDGKDLQEAKALLEALS